MAVENAKLVTWFCMRASTIRPLVVAVMIVKYRTLS